MNNKLDILKGLLDVIWNISDADYQERVWVKGLGPECSDFDEAMCNFFDDCNVDEILKNYKEYDISDKNYKLLLKFSKKLSAFSDKIPTNFDPRDILIDPEWHEIQKIAKKVLKAFSYNKVNTHGPIENVDNQR